MNLLDCITDQQILNLALTHICEREEDKCDPVAEKIVAFYAMKELLDECEEETLVSEIPEEAIKQRYSEMIVNKIIERLTNEGYVKVEFDNGLVGYEITGKGKEILEHGNQMFKDG